MPIKRMRKPLPWWLVVILALLGVVVAAVVVDAILSGGNHDNGMRGVTSVTVLAGDERGTYGDYPPEGFPWQYENAYRGSLLVVAKRASSPP